MNLEKHHVVSLWAIAIALSLYGCAGVQSGDSVDGGVAASMQDRVSTLVGPKIAILAATDGPTVIRQCSRRGPRSTGFWAPSRQEVLSAERELEAYLSKPNCATRDTLDHYFRQYIGFIRNGRRFLYVNALHDSVRNDFSVVGESPGWPLIPIVVCDGGDSFWGVEFDVEAQTFQNLECNGGA